MAFDAHKNLAVSTIVTAPSPATSGTSLVVTASEGARFPVPPFNATVWPSAAMPTPANAEVVRVTARTTDTLTIARAQEGTTARAMAAGDLIAASITAKTLTDLEIQAALLAAPNVFTQDQTIQKGAPRFTLVDTDQPANTRGWVLYDIAQNLYLRPVDDAGTLVGNPLSMTRLGDVFVERNLYEKGRATPLGHWQLGDAGAYTGVSGFTGPYSWTLIGKTLVIVMNASGSMPGGGSYGFNLPAGLTAGASGASGVVLLVPGTSWGMGNVHFLSGNPFFTVYREQLAAFPAGVTYIQLVLTLPVG